MIARLLSLRPDAIAVLIGYRADRRARLPLADPPRILDLSGQLSLTETVRLVANADLVVSNDTAPLHLALSTSVKVVGLFSPTRAETYLRRVAPIWSMRRNRSTARRACTTGSPRPVMGTTSA